MSKLLILATLLSPLTVAFAQDTTTPPAPRRAVVENMPKASTEAKYCIYEDKKYSEGAIKTADGRSMVCMAKEVFIQGESKELYWEYAESPRGKLHLQPAGASKR